jgi:hypothetical protein
MKNWVKRKLDEIDTLYMPEKLSRRKERWQSLWNGTIPADRYPFVYAGLLFNYYDDRHSPENRLRISLDEIIVRGHLDDDYVPSMFPGCKTSTIPNMFGAPEMQKGNDYTSEKIIHNYKDIDRLPDPSVGEGTVAYEWLTMQRYMLDETEGRIPIHVCDMQGPVDVAGVLLGYDNLFIAALDEPDYYHKLLDKLTQAFILLWKCQKDALGDAFVPTHLFGWSWVPPSLGASISADSIVMVSPDFFREFYRPYLDAIGNALGGFSLHSCGNFAHMFQCLTEIPRLKAVNAGQMSVKELVAAGLDSSLLAITTCGLKNIGEMAEEIKKNKLRVELSVWDIWPYADGKPVPLDEMTDTLWDEVKRKDEETGRQIEQIQAWA